MQDAKKMTNEARNTLWRDEHKTVDESHTHCSVPFSHAHPPSTTNNPRNKLVVSDDRLWINPLSPGTLQQEMHGRYVTALDLGNVTVVNGLINCDQNKWCMEIGTVHINTYTCYREHTNICILNSTHACDQQVPLSFSNWIQIHVARCLHSRSIALQKLYLQNLWTNNRRREILSFLCPIPPQK